MSYITTFDLCFFVAAICLPIGIGVQYLFGGWLVRKSIQYPVTSLVINAVVGIAAVYFWFSWSVLGTTTAVFWSTMTYIVLYKQVIKLNRFMHARMLATIGE